MPDSALNVIEKPWGREIILRQTADYVVKTLCVKAGCRLSLQYHRVKSEAMQLGSGHAILEIHEDGIVTEHNLEQSVEILPGTVHRLVAIDDCEVVEVSTPELDDVVRLEDDYKRVARARSARAKTPTAVAAWGVPRHNFSDQHRLTRTDTSPVRANTTGVGCHVREGWHGR